MIVKTKRMRIQALKQEDCEEFLKMDMNSQLIKIDNQNEQIKTDEAKAMIGQALDLGHARGSSGIFTILEEATDHFVGWITIWPESEKKESYELAYRLLPAYLGKGIEKEVSLAMVKKGFMECKLAEIFVRVAADYQDSIRLLEKIGLRFETLGENRELRYGVKREEWILKENALVSLGVRLSIKAIIERKGELLVTENGDHLEGSYYLLPGGGQEKKETMVETLKRECMEELGVRIRVGDFAVMREYIGANHEFAQWDEEFHQVELMFYCQLVEDPKKEAYVDGDLRQLGFAWIPIEELDGVRIYPKALIEWLKSDRNDQYLGDAN